MAAAKASRDAALTMAFGGTAFGILSWLDRPAVGLAVLVVCAGAAIALHTSHVGRRIERALDQQAERVAVDAERAGVELVKRIAANAQAMATLTTRFPELSAVPLSTSAMEPANLGILLQLLDELAPRRIVELGCGVSTHLITAWIRATGGHPCCRSTTASAGPASVVRTSSASACFRTLGSRWLRCAGGPMIGRGMTSTSTWAR